MLPLRTKSALIHNQDIALKSAIRLFDRGKFVGYRSQSTIEALYARGLIDLKRNRKGYVVTAMVRHNEQPASSSNGNGNTPPTQPPTGQRYSYQDDAIAGRPWDLKRLNGRRNGLNYAPKEALPAFTAVVRSCLKTGTD